MGRMAGYGHTLMLEADAPCRTPTVDFNNLFVYFSINVIKERSF